MNDITKIKVDGEPESSYQLYPRNEEFAKRAGGNSGSHSGVQPDWNQNNSTAADYVKNRPFYTGNPVETEIIPESTVTFSNIDGMMGAYWPQNFDAIEGQTYTISWDGTEYECVCTLVNGMLMLGNLAINGAGSNTGEPFIILGSGGFWIVGESDSATEHIIGIKIYVAQIVKIDEKYLPELMDKVNPTGTGSFSLNRKADTTVGDYSFAEGAETTASGDSSHAEGNGTTASGNGSHAEGAETTASVHCSHAEGYSTTASGDSSHAEGDGTTASGNGSHAEGYLTTASGDSSHAEGHDTTASGNGSHAEGYETKASSEYQHVQGKGNIEDSSGTYAHIVGNGTSFARSNAHTLDWSGNAWYAGTVEGKALILPSSTENSTKKFKITVDDSGAITTTEVT